MNVPMLPGFCCCHISGLGHDLHYTPAKFLAIQDADGRSFAATELRSIFGLLDNIWCYMRKSRDYIVAVETLAETPQVHQRHRRL